MGKKIVWLSVLQGFSMLLVVIGHVSLTNQPGDPSTPIASGIERTIYTFHMPLFIFISGWLFYHTCIGRKRPYKDMLVAKVKRLAVPFLAFTLVTTLLKVAFPQLMHRAVDMEEIINTFVLFRSNPLSEMWFLVVLFELMLLYPVYAVITRNKMFAAIALVITVLLNLFIPEGLTHFQLYRVAYMSPFFVAGILCCRYRWNDYMGNAWVLALLALLFVPCNLMGLLPKSMEVITASVGIAFSFSLCLILSRFFPLLFGSFRDYTFQIFLMGIFFQMLIRWIYVKSGNEALFVPMWLLSVLIGVYVPTLIAIVINKYAPRCIKMCFGL